MDYKRGYLPAAKPKMSRDCPFCKIVAGESPAKILHCDHQVTAFRDTHPIATTHILIVTNRHIASVNELVQEDESLVGHMVMVAKDLAVQEGIAERGYRLIINTGAHAGQSVFHLHLHLIGGKLTRFVVE
ncbi:MAG: histidine triad nucleotide-binding protein [Anaerolineales bacterium]